MQRKILGSLIVLALVAGALTAADNKRSIMLDKSFSALVVKVDDGKHFLLIQFQGTDGKKIEKSLYFPGSVKLSDFKPGTRYTFFEQGGKVIGVTPIVSAPVIKKAVNTKVAAATQPKQISKTPAKPVVKTVSPPPQKLVATTPPKQISKTPAKPVVKTVSSPPQKMTPLTNAVAEARKANQAKLAAMTTFKVKTAAYQTANAKVKAAEKFIAQADKAKATAANMVKKLGTAFQMTEVRVAKATWAASHAEATAKLAQAKVALAQADAFRAQAKAKVATAQLALAKVDANNLAQAKAFAVRFEKAKTIAAQAARKVYMEAKTAAAKAFQAQKAAQSVQTQKTKAAEQAATHVKQVQATQNQHTRVEVKKEVNKPVRH